MCEINTVTCPDDLPETNTVDCDCCYSEIDVASIRRDREAAQAILREQTSVLLEDGQVGRKHPEPLYHEDLYDTPWKDKPTRHYFCSENCRAHYVYEPDFAYFYCEGCERMICEQNPRNGWHTQVRHVGNGMPICLRCYQSMLLEDGQPKGDFTGDSIGGGMFFNSGNPKARNVGFRAVPGFKNVNIPKDMTVSEYNAKALQLIGEGRKVLTAYESMGIGGIEGYITLMANPPVDGVPVTDREALDDSVPKWV